MRCPNCLYNNHEQAEICERCGEPLHGENRLFNTCKNCGYINEAGAEFCESCGEPMAPSGLRKSARKKHLKAQKKKRKARTVRSSGDSASWFFLLILIFIAFMLLGIIPQAGVFAPAEVSEPHNTLLVLQGTSDLALSSAENFSDFSALAMDPEGIVRMGIYADGDLVGAQNYDPSNRVSFQPALSALPAGEHDIFIRSINSSGQPAYSQIITVTIDGGASGSFGLAADPKGLPVPADLRANSIDEGKRVSISWDKTEADVDGVRVYARPPGSSGLVHLADIRGAANQYDFSVDREGGWEIYTAYLSNEGYEGELGFVGLTVGEAQDEGAQTAVELPRPTQIRLAVKESDCQRTASQLGGARDAFHSACIAEVGAGQHDFLIWRWPLKWQNGALLTDADLMGFELKLVLSNSEGMVLGERIMAIPYSEIRGAFRASSDVACGIQRSWYLRAVGAASASDWAYAGSISAASCDPEAPVTDGCLGQADRVAMSNLPEGMMPDLLFETACEGHDLCYAEGAIGQPKVGCDNLFHTNLLAICSQKETEWDLGGCQKMAEAYYNAANLSGAAYYPQEPSFANCLEADHIAGCFRGNLPEVMQQGSDKASSGIIWTGKAAWTGVDRFVEGVLWVVDWGIGVMDSILPD